MRIENTVSNQPDAKQPLDICKNVLSFQQLYAASLVPETTPTPLETHSLMFFSVPTSVSHVQRNL